MLWKVVRKLVLLLALAQQKAPQNEPSWEWSHMGRSTNCDVHTKDRGTAVYVLVSLLVNPWLTLYKLTGWLASRIT